MILSYAILDILKEDLYEFLDYSDKVTLKELRLILKKEVLRPEVFESENAIKTFNEVNKFYINRKKEKDYWDKITIKTPDIFEEKKK